ncbi:coiled-coil domain-containing protein [Parerythrobacter jejuensis]|uniref:ATPase n=1 Tax=Parerythrobacter jejuensis TaxID=795812 RepID=A0A845ATU4_9SPHN|nr:ATPase [Parerythrobacter jejuensis]MXP32445.1 ATPase [Parerythrobacter jejuensis]
MSGGHHIRAVGATGTGETPSGDVTEGAEVPDSPYETSIDEEWDDDWSQDWDDAHSARNTRWILPTVAATVALAWTGFFGWANRDAMLAGATSLQWIDWVVSWSVPVLLIVALWLLAMRNSSREAARFADAASALSTESERLESRLTTVNRELSLAREFLSSQGLELESFGRITGERLSEHAVTLQSLVQTNGAQVDRIADVSEIALENMDRLRNDLPVIANSARDVSNQIGNAGGTAQEQLDTLVSGFERLNTFGEASERQVTALSEKVDATLAAFEAQATQMEEIAAARFTALRATSEDFRADLDSREVDVLAALRRRADQLAQELETSRGSLEDQEEEALKSMRARLTGLRTESETIARSIRDGEEEAKSLWIAQIDSMKTRLEEAVEHIRTVDDHALQTANKKLAALRDEATQVDAKLAQRDKLFNEQLDNRRSEIEQHQADALSALDDQLAAIDEAIARRREHQVEHSEALRASSEDVAAKVGELTGQITALASESEEAQQRLLETSAAAAERLAGGREDLIASQSAIEELTEASVRLLELIQASAQHSKEDLPAALAEAEQHLVSARETTEALKLMLEDGAGTSETISNYVITAQENGAAMNARADELREKLAQINVAYGEEVETLRSTLAALEEDGERVSGTATVALREAIAALEERTREALATAADHSSGEIDKIADGIAERSASAIDRAVREQSDSAIAELDEAATRSAGAAREAAVQLRDQLALVNELAGNLENRVALARERAEEQVDNDFARRVALITEALNSNAIDIAKSLSTDVTDTAWASYLRGDRGIFTRRAVALLDSTEAREIAELYDADSDFRDHVSRYIHDFEAMLRTMLSTRDGNAIGVTLLSSEMGKLYVALAQAIERLRTE